MSETGKDVHFHHEYSEKNEALPISNHQSPIDILTKEAKYDSSFHPLLISYDPNTSNSIVNVGHCFNVEFEDKDDKSVLKGGPLTGSYRLHQFHFHWGLSDAAGSEHAVDGFRHSAELHIVHWNSDVYADFTQAQQNPDGLAVLAVFLKIGKANPGLQKLIEKLDEVKLKGKRCLFKSFDLSALLPQSWNYWTYPGSLTVYPFRECVTWIVLQEHITISSEQLAKFRTLHCTAEEEAAHYMLENNRSLQPLQAREVRTSVVNQNTTDVKPFYYSCHIL
ncbi:carbonic anhydrase 13-like [Rhinatrema bivittatum]|uniref:carbonic anhydrase 13-like n=1 Tax=Rhinatrema bivittatum TaxID=194408 RepID=UPI00112C4D16|nr:carbonic anhydrase 13-like [Rhinatrema bivittatum]